MKLAKAAAAAGQPGQRTMGQDRGAKVRRKMLELSISKHTHTDRPTHMHVCIRVCLMKYLKLSTANRVATLSLSLSFLAYPSSANWRNWVYQFKIDHKLECKKKQIHPNFLSRQEIAEQNEICVVEAKERR